MKVPSRYGSHLPLLEWALSVTEGPVLEMGGGNFSTPYLAESGRDVTTYEPEENWRETLKEYENDTLHVVADLPDARHYALLFVDDEPEAERHIRMQRFDFDSAVIHDSWWDEIWDNHPNFRPRFRREFLDYGKTFPTCWFYDPGSELGPPSMFISHTPDLFPSEKFEVGRVHLVERG